jgi:hypothetical protein
MVGADISIVQGGNAKKNMVAHRKDEETYKIHLFDFKNVFLTFIYHSLDSSKPSSLVQEVEEV